MVTNKDGNVLDEAKGIICHQVNCKYVMGAGIALQISTKYPQHYKDYMATNLQLGKVVETEINERLYICGICGQDECGRGQCFTDYSALREGLAQVNSLSKEKSLPVFIPYKLGCGLAGGDWNIVKEIIKEETPNACIVKYSSYNGV